MMFPEATPFDDPTLKAALKRATAQVAAPAAASDSLRQRVTQLLVETRVSETSSPVPHRPIRLPFLAWFHPTRQLAIAASIAGLVLGAGLFISLDQFRPGAHSHLGYAMSTPVLMQTVLARHDALSQSVAGVPGLINANNAPYPRICDEVGRQTSLNFPRLDLSSRGWRFAGAKVYQTPEGSSAQLFYGRAKQSLSIFLVPSGIAPAELPCGLIRGRLVAGHIAGKTAFIVVGNGPTDTLTLAEVDAIADQLAGF